MDAKSRGIGLLIGSISFGLAIIILLSITIYEYMVSGEINLHYLLVSFVLLISLIQLFIQWKFVEKR